MQISLVITVAMFLAGGNVASDSDAQVMQSPDCQTELRRVADQWKEQFGPGTIVAGWCETKTLPDDKIEEMLKGSLPPGHPPVDAPKGQPNSLPSTKGAPNALPSRQRGAPGDTA